MKIIKKHKITYEQHNYIHFNKKNIFLFNSLTNISKILISLYLKYLYYYLMFL